MQFSECCAAEVALQHWLFCSADVILTKSCAAASEKLQCNIEKAALQESGAFLPLSCGFQAPTFRHPRLGPADSYKRVQNPHLRRLGLRVAKSTKAGSKGLAVQQLGALNLPPPRRGHLVSKHRHFSPGPFHTNNTTALESVVFCYRRSLSGKTSISDRLRHTVLLPSVANLLPYRIHSPHFYS